MKRPWSPYRKEHWWLAFQGARRSAAWRRVVWRLDPLEWWIIWESSGRWNERGRKSHQYCMARKGDKGAYEVGNVMIITNAENHAQRNRNKEIYSHTDQFRKDLAKRNREGRKLDMAQARAIRRLKGRMTQLEIARMFDISRQTVGAILNNERYIED